MAKLDCITTPTRAHGLWTVIGLEFIFLAMQLLKIYFFLFCSGAMLSVVKQRRVRKEVEMFANQTIITRTFWENI